MFFKKKKSSNIPNRRRHPRIKSLNLIRWSLVGEGEQGDGWIENIRDLSESGIRFSSEQQVPKKGVVRILLSLTRENREIEILGEIAWVKEVEAYGTTYSQVGILFTEIKEEERVAVKQFIEQLKSS